MTKLLAKLHEVEKAVTWRYSLAVVIVALLSTGGYAVLWSAMHDSESTAYIVNVSGKQRMLSQHLVLDVHRLHNKLNAEKVRLDSDKSHIQTQNQTLNKNNNLSYKSSTSASIEVDALKKRIERLAYEMRKANQQLTSGNFANRKHVNLSAEISDMYFGEMNLFHRVFGYTQYALNSIQTNNLKAISRNLSALDARSEALLSDLNKVVSQYQKEGEQSLDLLTQLETAMWLITLLILALEILFIFRPMVKAVVKATLKEREAVDSLQDQVELRTMKLEAANQRLLNLATQDPLTGVKNRLTLESEIENLIDAYQHNKQDFGLIIADIDWFKNVNDSLGHNFGDFVIKEFAKVLDSQTREGDTVYRFGGEEFVILMNRIKLEDLMRKVELIRKKVQAHKFKHAKNTTYITASFGVFFSGNFAKFKFTEVINLADGALYESKALGRNRVTFAEQNKASKTNKLMVKTAVFRYADIEFSSLVSVGFDIESILGYSAEQLIAENTAFGDLVHAHDCDVLEYMSQHCSKGQLQYKALRMRTREGPVVIVNAAWRKYRNYYEVSVQNVVDIAKPFGDELLVQNFHAMLENTNDFIYFKDKYHVFTAASESIVALTNVNSREELVGKTDYQVVDTKLADEYFKLEKEIFNGEVEVSRKLQKVVTIEGEESWIDNRKYPIKNSNNEIVGLFGVARVITLAEYEKLNFLEKSEQQN